MMLLHHLNVFRLSVLLLQLACFSSTGIHRNVASGDSYLAFDEEKAISYRETVRGMFHRAYDAYLRYAYPKDELRPLTCSGMNTWGDFSLTLVDALDTLGIMGNWSEFRRAARMAIARVSNLDRDINISVFESNIRVVGGLLGAHMLAKRAGLYDADVDGFESGGDAEAAKMWPCGGPLLHLAERLAQRLLPAFNSNTSMPYGTVNLMHGVPKGETSVTCTAAIGTFIVEFGTLSRLTGDPRYERAALRAIQSLYSMRTQRKGLYGNHLDVETGRWTMIESRIGSSIDSFFEYLVKGAVMLDHPHLMHIYRQARRAVDTYLLTPDDWFRSAHAATAETQTFTYQSLESFWPGMLTLTGEIEQAKRTMLNYASVARQFGLLPEVYEFNSRAPIKEHEQYPMRPEYVESLYYLYRATRDPIYRHYAAAFVDALQHITSTDCGYAVVRYVSDHALEDRMESFFLAETLKYLYLIFDDDNFIHSIGSSSNKKQHQRNDGAQTVRRLKVYGRKPTESDGRKYDTCAYPDGDGGGSGDLAYMFNSEAHIVDLDALECCHHVWRQRKGEHVFDYYQDLQQMGRWFRAYPPPPTRREQQQQQPKQAQVPIKKVISKRKKQKQAAAAASAANAAAAASAENGEAVADEIHTATSHATMRDATTTNAESSEKYSTPIEQNNAAGDTDNVRHARQQQQLLQRSRSSSRRKVCRKSKSKSSPLFAPWHPVISRPTCPARLDDDSENFDADDDSKSVRNAKSLAEAKQRIRAKRRRKQRQEENDENQNSCNSGNDEEFKNTATKDEKQQQQQIPLDEIVVKADENVIVAPPTTAEMLAKTQQLQSMMQTAAQFGAGPTIGNADGGNTVSFTMDQATMQALQEHFMNSTALLENEQDKFPSFEELKNMPADEREKHFEQSRKANDAVRNIIEARREELMKNMEQNDFVQFKLPKIDTSHMKLHIFDQPSSDADVVAGGVTMATTAAPSTCSVATPNVAYASSSSSAELELYMRMSFVSETFALFNESKLLACDISSINSIARRYAILNQVAIRT